VDGKLYGTSAYGSVVGYRTVFRIDASGRIRILHSFRQLHTYDGIFPYVPLLYLNNYLYGTTYLGGRERLQDCYHSDCRGTVFGMKL
jgi:uncharacterized repeat protein (TIGR03803 family)